MDIIKKASFFLLLITVSLPIFGQIIDYIPKRSLNQKSIDRHLNQNKAVVQYLSESLSSIPVIPYQVFAVEYLEDIVIETNHPKISMHELAKIRVNNEDVWIAKDSTIDGTQTLTLPDEKYLSLFPEINVPRRVSKFEINDTSTKEKLNIVASYKNQFNEKQIIEFSSPRLTKKNQQTRTNGSTFNHSKKSVSALLDISHKNLKGINAKVTYENLDYKIRKIFKTVPIKALLQQTQAGFSSGEFTQVMTTENGIHLKRNDSLDERWTFDKEILSTSDSLREISHHYNENSELIKSIIHAENKEVLNINFSAPLPDFNKSFDQVKRNFVVYVNGKGQGIGEITLECDDNHCEILISPLKPRWFKSRPVRIKINKQDGLNEFYSEMINN